MREGNILQASYQAKLERAQQRYEAGEIPHRDCELCGEPADQEMGEFTIQAGYLPQDTRVFAHAQSAAEQGLEIA